mmetsp:Transcript_54749/g.132461  ORF Transcript_54749/g.132461 Transcript_54749/m.132461 type:complete len:222 (+) Transcript_54749:1226-1891(+)
MGAAHIPVPHLNLHFRREVSQAELLQGDVERQPRRLLAVLDHLGLVHELEGAVSPLTLDAEVFVTLSEPVLGGQVRGCEAEPDGVAPCARHLLREDLDHAVPLGVLPRLSRQRSREAGAPGPDYTGDCGGQAPEEVVVVELRRGRVDIVQEKLDVLVLLKVVVDVDGLLEAGVEVVLDHFCAASLGPPPVLHSEIHNTDGVRLTESVLVHQAPAFDRQPDL